VVYIIGILAHSESKILNIYMLCYMSCMRVHVHVCMAHAWQSVYKPRYPLLTVHGQPNCSILYRSNTAVLKYGEMKCFDPGIIIILLWVSRELMNYNRRYPHQRTSSDSQYYRCRFRRTITTHLLVNTNKFFHFRLESHMFSKYWSEYTCTMLLIWNHVKI
jgi:hypothetical protein